MKVVGKRYTKFTFMSYEFMTTIFTYEELNSIYIIHTLKCNLDRIWFRYCNIPPTHGAHSV